MTPRTQGARVRRLMIRGRPTSGSFILGRVMVQDKKLPAEARMIATYLLSQPPDWVVRVPQISDNFGWGKDKVYRFLKLLIVAGYGARRHTQGDSGLFDGVEYVICDDRAEVERLKAQWRSEGSPAMDDPEQEDASISPSPVLPDADEPDADNADHIHKGDTYKTSPPTPAPGSTRSSDPPRRSEDEDRNTETVARDGSAVPPVSGLPRETAAIEVSPGAPAGIADAGTRDAVPLATSQREKASAKPTPDAARFDRWSHKLGKRAGDRAANWTAYTEADESDLAECDRLIDALVASIESHGARMPPLHKIIRGKLWQSIPPPKPVEPKPHFVPKSQGGFRQYLNESAEAAVCSATGARAVREGWAIELYDFVRNNRRLPDALECNRLYAKGRDSLRYDVDWIMRGQPRNDNEKLALGMAEGRMQRRQKFGDMAKSAATSRGENLIVPTAEYWVKELASEATATAPARESEPEYIEALEF